MFFLQKNAEKKYQTGELTEQYYIAYQKTVKSPFMVTIQKGDIKYLKYINWTRYIYIWKKYKKKTGTTV